MSHPDLLRMPEAPRWDPDSGANPFHWIVAEAPKLREQRMDHMAGRRAAQRIARIIASRPVNP